MGAAESGVWYAMTLAFEKGAKKAPDCSRPAPFAMNTWLVPTAADRLRAARDDTRVVTPPVDVRIGNDEITLLADLPGILRENIDIRLLPRYVEIIGKPAECPKARDPAAARAGMTGIDGPAREQIPVAPNGAQARLLDGVLEVRLPRQVLFSGRGPSRLPVR
jgi:HSP20 family molecular chaperone IbpA